MSALSLEAPDTREGARISIHSKGTLYGVDRPDRTLADLFEDGRKTTGDGNFLGTTSGQVTFGPRARTYRQLSKHLPIIKLKIFLCLFFKYLQFV